MSKPDEFRTLAVLPQSAGIWYVRISPNYPGRFFFVSTDRRCKPVMIDQDGSQKFLENAENPGSRAPLILPVFEAGAFKEPE